MEAATPGFAFGGTEPLNMIRVAGWHAWPPTWRRHASSNASKNQRNRQSKARRSIIMLTGRAPTNHNAHMACADQSQCCQGIRRPITMLTDAATLCKQHQEKKTTNDTDRATSINHNACQLVCFCLCCTITALSVRLSTQEGLGFVSCDDRMICTVSLSSCWRTRVS